jgi:branched-chain amino acid transport system permease protein
MPADVIAITLVSAIASAAVLLIATLGLAVVFGLMGVVNLAHGEFLMIGAYAALLSTRQGLPFWAAVTVAVSISAAFGAVVEVLIIRRLYHRIFDTMLATWGLSLVLYQASVMMFGAVTPGLGFSFPSVAIGAYSLSSYLLVLVVIAALLVVALYWLLTRSNYGILARAVVQDPQMSAAIGIDAARINTATFALGCGLAGFAGAVLSPIVPATPGMGFAFVVKAFLAVVVAGPLTLSGTIVASGALGALANVAASLWSAVLGDLLFFGMTIALLRFFPRGISERWRLKL